MVRAIRRLRVVAAIGASAVACGTSAPTGRTGGDGEGLGEFKGTAGGGFTSVPGGQSSGGLAVVNAGAGGSGGNDRAGSASGGGGESSDAGHGGNAGGAGNAGPDANGAIPAAGSGAMSGSSSAGAGGLGGCELPASVSFQRDVQPFLGASCGGGNGCHVIDGASTMSAGGYNHAYDWITGGAHTSSCPSGPMRFEIVLDVLDTENPPTCAKSRLMPPPGTKPALTRCEIATLRAWLDQPMVTQKHRADDSSPTAPYPMPPFN